GSERRGDRVCVVGDVGVVHPLRAAIDHREFAELLFGAGDEGAGFLDGGGTLGLGRGRRRRCGGGLGVCGSGCAGGEGESEREGGNRGFHLGDILDYVLGWPWLLRFGQGR